MRVLHLVHQLDYCDGSGRHVFLLAREQKRRGYTVSVAVGKGDAIELLQREGIDSHVIHTISHETRSPSRFVKGMISVRKLIWRFRPDVVHTHHYYIANQVIRFPFGHSVPAVLTVHANIPFQGRLPHYVGDQIIAVSESTKRLILAFNPELPNRVTVIPYGAGFLGLGQEAEGMHQYQQLIEARKHSLIITFAGRLVPQKGVHILLEALARLKDTAACVCAIAGAGTGELLLRETANRLRIQTVFLGQLRDVKAVLEISDIVAVPSLEWEGLPIILIESGLMERAVVASKTDGIPELIEHERTGLLVQPGDVQGLAEAIKRLVNDPALRRTIGKALSQKVQQNHSVSAMAEQVEHVYQRVLNSRS